MRGGLNVRGVCKQFGGVPALRGIDLDLPAGQNLVIVGPSGSGKSTLLRVIAGLEAPDEGHVHIDGASQNGVPAHRRDIAMVFQHFALYPHLNARDNITLGLRHGLRLSKAEASARAQGVAQRLAIEDLLGRLPRQMSGGQRQRVALARALARQAGVVLLDEPLSGLDAQLRMNLRAEITSVLNQSGATTVHVTHDQLDAMAMADKIAVINRGEIEQIAPPDEIYRQPATLFVATFVGTPSMSTFEPDSAAADTRITPFGLRRLRTGGRVTFGVRPEHVLIGCHSETMWTTMLAHSWLPQPNDAMARVKLNVCATARNVRTCSGGNITGPSRIAIGFIRSIPFINLPRPRTMNVATRQHNTGRSLP